MTWWLFQNSRLGAEKKALAKLEVSVDWLSIGRWHSNNDLEMCVDFTIALREKSLGFQMRYPSIFPDTPPMIFTEDASRISNHQYGASGELCLEHRPENWHPLNNGADMVVSCYRLIVEEQPEHGEPIQARSAHIASLGRDLRSKTFRFLMSEKNLKAVNELPENQGQIFCLSKRIAATSFIASTVRLGPRDNPIWVSDFILPDGHVEETGIVVRVQGSRTCGAITTEVLEVLLESVNLGELRSRLFDTDVSTNLLMGDGDSWELFEISGKSDDRKIITYTTVNVPVAQKRLPADFDILHEKKIGIVGCGSVGSKIAASLCRTGIREFLLVDEDIFFPGNVVRNELDLKFVGAHKALALRERLTNLAPRAKVKTLRMSLGGQESSAFMTCALEALGDCDAIIDATASSTAFSILASIATRKRKPMVWAEVFAGGIGGLVARARPDLDPVPLLARIQIDN